MSDVLYLQDVLTQSQMTASLRRLKRHVKFGLYAVVEDLDNGKFNVQIWGPKLRWERQIKVVWELKACKQD